MIFYLTSKTFQNVFLVNETDNSILKAQYVIVSSRIRVKDRKLENIVVGTSMLFPDPDVCSSLTNKELREKYFNQLLKSGPFIAALIKGSIKEGYNIIFICTESESKLKYLKYLSEFIYYEYEYPVYEYGSYASGAAPLLKYDKTKVLKKANRILKAAKAEGYKRNLQSENGRKSIMKDYKKMKKKDLKKILQKRDLYHDGMDKEEMLDMLEVFMT